jgi:tRNA-dihydrouridine synthase B
LIKNKIFALAPLAGWTDFPFRKSVKKFGATLTVSEMISAQALVHNAKKSYKMIQKSSNEVPYSVQIATNSPQLTKEAVLILNNIKGIDIIDLNAGCPAPKVVRSGNGSKLLTNLNLLTSIVKTIKQTSNKKLTSVKTRLGFDKENIVDIARAIEDGGADFITIHGRTKAGGYKAEVDYEAIAKAKEAVKIPVIANGDISSYEKAQLVFKTTKCDGVMIGRAALGKPWIFKQLKEKKHYLSAKEKIGVIIEHFDNMIEFYGDYGTILFRKHLHNYSKGLQDGAKFRMLINKIEDPIQMREAIVEFFNESFRDF